MMRKIGMAAVLAGLGFLSTASSEEGKAPPPAAPARPQRCVDCNKARMFTAKGEVGYCEHCGILYARIQKDGLDKAKEALTKAGATDIQSKGPFLTAKAGKDLIEAARKALAPFLQKPEPPPEPEPEPEK